jgi:2-oxoglutarate dehydrogenase E2 component (dihydrolipoamide succinyltransferase)
MSTDVIMPQMGESIFEGTITKWLKKAGEPVEKDEPLFEISTDKVDAEIPSPVAGVLSEIMFPEGATVQVNTVVAVLSENGTSGAGSGASGARTAAPEKTVVEQTVTEAKGAAAQSGEVNVVMPQMGESIFEGTITKWLKKAGDSVKRDEPLFEISTDKVDAEIPSPVDGVLTEIKAVEGETVQVNTVVAVIGTSGSGGRGTPGADKRASGAKAETVNAASKPAPAVKDEPVVQAPQAQSAPPQVVRSSPLVRRIAKEHNIDLTRVRGTGSNGRVTKDDILAHLKQPGTEERVLTRAVAQQPMTDEVVPLTKMRAIIAQRMSESKRTIPHAHTVYKVDMTRVVRLRERERDGFEKRHGVKLTYMPFIAAAAIDALRRYPVLNASLMESSIHYHAHINLGIAVALEWGLIVPVVRESEQRDFVALAKAINDLAGRARAKKLMPDEVGGSTFTLTNSGAFGGEYGMPVINPPESAILAIGGLRKEPVVLTDAEGDDTIAIRSVQYYCLGFDHRLIDGADSGKFMTEFKNVLESWDRAIM